ncbi:hypothetical protein C8J57DRAFT_1657255 [Mycena rebaudengoi]|nr:hypothetical protein C8J57DRAFT_1657255 [Mycena rebaudengoi]
MQHIMIAPLRLWDSVRAAFSELASRVSNSRSDSSNPHLLSDLAPHPRISRAPPIVHAAPRAAHHRHDPTVLDEALARNASLIVFTRVWGCERLAGGVHWRGAGRGGMLVELKDAEERALDGDGLVVRPRLRVGYAPTKRARLVSRVALCAGSGGSMLAGTPADLYLRVEMTHHKVLVALAADTHVVLCAVFPSYFPPLSSRLDALCLSVLSLTRFFVPSRRPIHSFSILHTFPSSTHFCGHTNTKRGFFPVLFDKLHAEIELPPHLASSEERDAEVGLYTVEVLVSERGAHSLAIASGVLPGGLMPKKARSSPSVSSTTAATPQVARHAVFDACHNFTVSGGTFIVQSSINDPDESDFRRVRWGDLNFLKDVATQNIVEYQDVCHKRTGVVKKRVPQVVGVRKIRHAHIFGSQETVTAVVYEASNFEKHRTHAEWREDFRHSLMVQLLGVTSGPRRNALLYHDGKRDTVPLGPFSLLFYSIAGLIPLDEYRQIYKQSTVMSALLEYEIGRHFFVALDHWDNVTGMWLLGQDSYGFRTQLEIGTMLWIRSSTGQLCIEVNDDKEQDCTMLPLALGTDYISGVHLTSDTNVEEKLFSDMSLDDIHTIFAASGWWDPIEISEPGAILLRSLSWPTASCAHQFNPFSEISLSNSLGLGDVHVSDWEDADSYTQGSSFPNEGLVTLPNGWTRVALVDVPIDEECRLLKHIYLSVEGVREVRTTWLSQANHVLDKSGLDADDCYLLTDLALRFSISSNADEFTLQGTFMADSPSDDVYLFLFPAKADNSNAHLVTHLPPENETYYWSFDPKGVKHLCQDALDKLALPHVDFQAQVYGDRWSQGIYDFIGQCHRAKGFDPTSQDVAVKLGHLLVDVDRLNNLINGDKASRLHLVVERKRKKN